MKKLILSLLIGISVAANAGTFTVTVQPGTFTNLLNGFPGSIYVSRLVMTAGATNASVLVIDTPTNTFTFVTPAYTNYTTYATNIATTYTNYYGTEFLY